MSVHFSMLFIGEGNSIEIKLFFCLSVHHQSFLVFFELNIKSFWSILSSN